MAIRKIARMGHPVLQGVAKPVPDPTAPEVKALVRDMIETMIDANMVLKKYFYQKIEITMATRMLTVCLMLRKLI